MKYLRFAIDKKWDITESNLDYDRFASAEAIC